MQFDLKYKTENIFQNVLCEMSFLHGPQFDNTTYILGYMSNSAIYHQNK